MDSSIIFDAELIRKYDREGPRYTSYPTAPQFHSDFNETCQRAQVRLSNQEIIPKPLSLYFHIPFCDTICYYCACNKVITKDRSRADDYVSLLNREMSLYAPLIDSDREVQQIHFGGGTPTFLNMQQMAELMQAIHTQFSIAEVGEYSIEIDPRKADTAIIAGLAELGLNRLSIGIQDLDPRVQEAVNRVQPKEHTLECLTAARNHGFSSINMDLIYGLPHQSVASFDRTLDQIIDWRPERLSVFNYAHLPHRFKPQRRIDDTDLPDASTKLQILQHTIEKLTAAGYVYIGMDHFALADDSMTQAQNEGSLQRNFQGYSTHAQTDLLALGVSSISHMGDSYSQNDPDLEQYREKVLLGQLPVVRGLNMSETDHLHKWVIDQLICHFQLDFAEFQRHWHLDFKDFFSQQLNDLKQMEDDGLLKINADGILVLPPGRLLIRNICMLFDAYLNTNNVVKFSRAI